MEADRPTLQRSAFDEAKALLYLEDFLVEVWRLYTAERLAEARALLLRVWSWGMDSAASEQDVRVASRLLRRLAPCIDDEDGWRALPDPLVVYRAHGGYRESGFSWTLRRDIAESLAKRYDLPEVREGQIAKRDVLAYITWYGEQEILAAPGSVTCARPH